MASGPGSGPYPDMGPGPGSGPYPGVPGAGPAGRPRGQRPGGPWPGQRPGTGPGPQTEPVRPGAGPARQRVPRSARGEAQYPPDRYPSGGYDDGDSWGGDFGDSSGSSFVPGLGGRDDFPGADAGFGSGEYEGAAWQGDDYDDGYDGPRERRGRSGRRSATNARSRADYADYDDYDSRDSMPVPKKKKKKRGPLRRLAPWIALLVILVPIVGGGLYGYSLYMAKFHPADYTGSGTGPAVTVEVRQGDTASSVAPELARLGVVASARAFVLAAENSTSKAGLEPGTYRLSRHMKAALAYAAMLNPKNRMQLTLGIPEGQRVAQVIATLAKNMNVPVTEFQDVLNHPSQLGLPSYAKGKAEGFLWPATYNIQPKTKPLQVLQSMVGKFNQVARQQNFQSQASARGLSMHQLLIEASIVQAEGNRPDELPKIARVIVNRLNRNMPLQFDSVLEYGQNRFAVNIQNSWARIPGPYNDFQNRGLPPTPICNPGLDAINAVLHPAPGNWLYFLAFPNGKSEFSATPLKGMS